MKNKRVLSLLLAVMILLSSLPFAGVTAFAAKSGAFTYKILSDGTAQITAYSGTSANLTIPSSLGGYTVTSIGKEAFYDCDSLVSVKIPYGVKSIEYQAFYDCDSLESVEFPNSLISIGNQAFSVCYKLTNITIPDSVTNIGGFAFKSCSNLNNIDIPDSVNSIGTSAFYDTAYYQNESNWKNGVLYLGNHLIEAKSSLSGSYSIKKGTITIADAAFFWCDDYLTGITIPSSVRNIGTGAFESCYQLKKVTMSNGITNIGSNAFYNCQELTNITIPESVKSIGSNAFACCYNLTSATLSNGLTSIGDEAFSNCSRLKSITIPNSVKSIEKLAFYDCESLKSVIIPNGVEKIGDGAFEYCTNVTSISLPNSISSIGSGVFSGTAYSKNKSNWENGVLYIGKHLLNTNDYFHRNIKGYSIKSGTLTIAAAAFGGRENLQNVTIPSSVKSIGQNAFQACGFLNSVYYKGTKAQWNKISIGSGNDDLFLAKIYCNALETPKISSVSGTATGIQIKWGKVTGAEKYRVFYKNSVETTWHKAGDSASTSYTWTGAKSGIEYFFTVRCLSGDGKSYTSNYDPTGKNIDYIAAPKLSSVTNTATGVQIKWGKVNWAAKYRVFYKTGNGNWKKLVDTTSTSYTWKDAKKGTKYSFTVRCVTSDGELYTSGYDNTGKSITYSPNLATPKLSSVSNTATGVKISWGKVTGAAKYRVFYKTGNSGWKKLADTTSTSYTWKGAKSDTKYTFTVRCLSKDGKSYTSAYDSKGKTITYVAAPKISSLSKTSSGVQIKWGKVTGAVNYKVFRKTANGKWTVVGTTTSTSFVDKTAKKGTKYTYTVRCISKDGKSYTSSYDSKGKTITC